MAPARVVYIGKTVPIRGGYAAADGFADASDPHANPTAMDTRRRVIVIQGAGSTTGDPRHRRR